MAAIVEFIDFDVDASRLGIDFASLTLELLLFRLEFLFFLLLRCRLPLLVLSVSLLHAEEEHDGDEEDDGDEEEDGDEESVEELSSSILPRLLLLRLSIILAPLISPANALDAARSTTSSGGGSEEDWSSFFKERFFREFFFFFSPLRGARGSLCFKGRRGWSKKVSTLCFVDSMIRASS